MSILSMEVLLPVLLAAAGALLTACMLLRKRSADAVPIPALIERLDDLLPQTQCGQCTFAGCRPYAVAMATGVADSNQCPPGGDVTAARLAILLGREVKPVDPRFGDAAAPALVAVIDENRCIGCALCLPACPVDAIIGAARHTHTVIASECTGCKLCLPPCPVDCIEMQPAPVLPAAARESRSRHFRRRYLAHTARLDGAEKDRQRKLKERRGSPRRSG